MDSPPRDLAVTLDRALPSCATPRTVRESYHFDLSMCHTRSASPSTREPKQDQEEVDEIQIERQGSDDRIGSDLAFRQRQRHLLQTLRVPGGEPGKHDHADDGDQELQGLAVPEHADD